jgi:hypothetical protein
MSKWPLVKRTPPEKVRLHDAFGPDAMTAACGFAASWSVVSLNRDSSFAISSAAARAA